MIERRDRTLVILGGALHVNGWQWRCTDVRLSNGSAVLDGVPLVQRRLADASLHTEVVVFATDAADPAPIVLVARMLPTLEVRVQGGRLIDATAGQDVGAALDECISL